MTEIQKRWLPPIGIVLLGLLSATSFQPGRIATLPLWMWGVLLLLAGLGHFSRIWLWTDQWQTTKYWYALVSALCYGLFEFLFALLLPSNNAPLLYISMTGYAIFAGILCGLIAGLISVISYKPHATQRNLQGS